jgi:NAD-dependent deacetylase
MPYFMEQIEAALGRASLFIAVGTSGHVYPAAGFVRLARYAGAKTIEVNNQNTSVSGDFDSHRVGAAGSEMPLLVDEILGAS